MMAICRICLCTSQAGSIMLQTLEGPLRNFYDELCGKGTKFSDALYCPICVHLLEKFYNFRNKCSKAKSVFTEWQKQYIKPFPKSMLHTTLPPTSLGFCNNANRYIYYYNEDDSKGYKDFDISSSDKHIIIKPLNIKEESVSNTFTDTNECNKDLTEAHEHYEDLTAINTDIEYLDFEMLDSDITDADIRAESDDKHFLVDLAKEKELNASQGFYDNDDKTNSHDVILIDDYTSEDDTIRGVTNNDDIHFNNPEDDNINDDIDFEENTSEDDINRGVTNNDDVNYNNPEDDSINDDIDFEDVEDDNADDKVTKIGLKRKLGYNIKVLLKEAFKTNLTNDELLLIKCALFSTNQDIQAEIKEHGKVLELEELLSVEMNQVKNELRSKLQNGDLKDKDGNIIDVDVILNNLEKLTKPKYDKIKRYCAGDGPLTPRAIRLLSQVHRHYGNLYSSVFVTKHLTTDEEVMEAFRQREQDPSYIKSEHKCTKCLRYFKSAKYLDYHNSELHNPKNQVKCKYCDVRVNGPKALRNHSVTHRVVFQCKLCPLVTNYTSVRDVHFNIHKGVKYPCTKCDAVFRTPQVLSAHFNRCHYVVCLACPFCALAFHSEAGLHTHKKRKHADILHTVGPPSAKCEQCDVQFISDEVYLKHRKKSHDKDILTNKSNNKSYKTLKKRKILEIINKRKYTCRVCSTVVSSIGALVTHFKSSHPQDSYDMTQMALRPPHKYLCDQCGKGFRFASLLEDHKNVHSGLRPYSCLDCPKSFHSRSHLHNHILLHAPPNYQCDVCGKTFKTATHLNTHNRTHIGDRRYACHLCGKSFLHQGSVTEHVRGVHHQIRREKKRTKRTNVE